MTDNTKMREAFIQACKEYGPTISFSDFECGWDACMAWQAARTVPEGFVMVPVEILQLIQCDVENSADWLSNSTSVLRNLLAAAPEPKK